MADTRYADWLSDDERAEVEEAMEHLCASAPIAKRPGDDRLWRVENAIARYVMETRTVAFHVSDATRY